MSVTPYHVEHIAKQLCTADQFARLPVTIPARRAKVRELLDKVDPSHLRWLQDTYARQGAQTALIFGLDSRCRTEAEALAWDVKRAAALEVRPTPPYVGEFERPEVPMQADQAVVASVRIDPAFLTAGVYLAQEVRTADKSFLVWKDVVVDLVLMTEKPYALCHTSVPQKAERAFSVLERWLNRELERVDLRFHAGTIRELADELDWEVLTFRSLIDGQPAKSEVSSSSLHPHFSAGVDINQGRAMSCPRCGHKYEDHDLREQYHRDGEMYGYKAHVLHPKREFELQPYTEAVSFKVYAEDDAPRITTQTTTSNLAIRNLVRKLIMRHRQPAS